MYLHLPINRCGESIEEFASWLQPPKAVVDDEHKELLHYTINWWYDGVIHSYNVVIYPPTIRYPSNYFISFIIDSTHITINNIIKAILTH